MSRKPYRSIQQLVVATMLVFGASGIALGDDSSMRRFGGDSYAYFSQPIVGDTAANLRWRQTHPNGLSNRELQALSSSDVSASASQLSPPVFATAAADPTWRQSHPTGLTERELMALSSSSLSRWQADGSVASPAQDYVAQGPAKETLAARLTNFLHPKNGNAVVYP